MSHRSLALEQPNGFSCLLNFKCESEVPYWVEMDKLSNIYVKKTHKLNVLRFGIEGVVKFPCVVCLWTIDEDLLRV